MSGLETLRAHACSAFVGAFWRPLPRFLLQACRERAQPGPCRRGLTWLTHSARRG